MKKYVQHITILLLLFSTIQGANEPIETDTKAIHTYTKHNVGVGAGAVSGIGFSYRRWFESGHGFQVNFGPIVSSDFYAISLGINGLYSVHESKYSNFFLYYGSNFMSMKEERYEYYYGYDYENSYDYSYPNENEKYYYYDYNFFNGGGCGVEIRYKFISLSIQAGISATYFAGSGENDYLIHPTGEAALHYSFGDF